MQVISNVCKSNPKDTWQHYTTSDLINININAFRMLCKDPRRRATISELLAHPWLNRDFGSSTDLKFDSSSCVVPDAVVTRLQQFAAMNRFKKEARKILAMFLPEEEVSQKCLSWSIIQYLLFNWLASKISPRLLDCSTYSKRWTRMVMVCWLWQSSVMLWNLKAQICLK